jgi:hypothetical protein
MHTTSTPIGMTNLISTSSQYEANNRWWGRTKAWIPNHTRTRVPSTARNRRRAGSVVTTSPSPRSRGSMSSESVGLFVSNDEVPVDRVQRHLADELPTGPPTSTVPATPHDGHHLAGAHAESPGLALVVEPKRHVVRARSEIDHEVVTGPGLSYASSAACHGQDRTTLAFLAAHSKLRPLRLIPAVHRRGGSA